MNGEESEDARAALSPAEPRCGFCGEPIYFVPSEMFRERRIPDHWRHLPGPMYPVGAVVCCDGKTEAKP